MALPFGRAFSRYAPISSWWHDGVDGDWAVESSQDCTPMLDANREAANHCDPYNEARDVKMVARIPLIVIAKWRNELGVDYWNPDHQAKVDALLADPEWAWLRVDGGNAGRTQVLMSEAAGLGGPERPVILDASGAPMKSEAA